MRYRFVVSLVASGMLSCAAAPPSAQPTRAVVAPAAPNASAKLVATSPARVTVLSSADAAVSTGNSSTKQMPKIAPLIEELQKTALASRAATELVRSLTDEVGARPAGSAGDKAGVEWALRTFKSLGYENVHSEPVKVKHWDRGQESAELLAPAKHPLQVAALGGSIGTPPAGIEAEVAEFSTLAQVEALPAGALKGKIAFLNVPMRRAATGMGYAETVEVRWRGWQVAAKAGAIAVVIRSIGTDQNRLPHTGSMGPFPETKAIPAAALSVPDAELLHRILVEKGSARLRLKLGARWLPDTMSANVIGEIRGTKQPEEIILLGAHLDSWDLGTGAIDDGAGCGIVLQAGSLLLSAKYRPERTVRVVLFANEEHGVAGARNYAEVHAAELEKHILAFEADMGTARAESVRFSGGPGAQELFRPVVDNLLPLGIEWDSHAAYGGTDVGPLKRAGVPVLDLRQDASLYFDYHHTANDTFDKIDPAGLAQMSAAFATVAYSVAGLSANLGRIPTEQRGARF